MKKMYLIQINYNINKFYSIINFYLNKMKIKNNKIDTFFYILLCIFTGGMAYFARIIITKAIIKAFENKND